jgi:GntR family transcriptional regulator
MLDSPLYQCTIWLVHTVGALMFLHVDPSNGIAIYDQIVRQVKFAVASDALKPGNLVPSVREMARDLTVNPNTVARAYRELQADNVLQPLRGTGLEITTSAPKKCLADRAALIRARLRSVLAEARQSGLAADEIRALTEQELARLESQKEPS